VKVFTRDQILNCFSPVRDRGTQGTWAEAVREIHYFTVQNIPLGDIICLSAATERLFLSLFAFQQNDGPTHRPGVCIGSQRLRNCPHFVPCRVTGV